MRLDPFPTQMYNLTFPGRHTVNQVKRDVATVTGIPVFRQVQYLEEHLNISVNDARYIHHQEWTGWPEDTNDELSLLQISLPIVHTLTVTQVDLCVQTFFLLLNWLFVLWCDTGWFFYVKNCFLLLKFITIILIVYWLYFSVLVSLISN